MIIGLADLRLEIQCAIEDMNELNGIRIDERALLDYAQGYFNKDLHDLVSKYSYVFIAYKNLDKLLRSNRQRFNKEIQNKNIIK